MKVNKIFSKISDTQIHVKNKKLKPIKELNLDFIWSISLLKNGRLISNNKKQIFFHNKENDNLEIVYRDKMELSTISNFTELADSIFCFCQEDLFKDLYCIKIIKLKFDTLEEIQTINFGCANINKIIRINSNTFASSSKDRIIRIWELNKKINRYYLKTKIKINDFCGYDFNNIFLINKKTIAYYSKTFGKKSKKVIIFLNIIKGNKIKQINDIDCLTRKDSMILVKKRFLIICAVDGIYAIDINTYDILSNLKIQGFDSSVFKFREGFLIFIRENEKKKNEYFLKECIIEKDISIKIKNILLYINESENKISDIIQKDYNTLIILDYFGKITFWEYA